MITVIENYVQCDECGKHLSYGMEDTEVSWNWNHKYQIRYLKCPNCDNDIPIKRLTK